MRWALPETAKIAKGLCRKGSQEKSFKIADRSGSLGERT
jgi:hypothetical protein